MEWTEKGQPNCFIRLAVSIFPCLLSSFNSNPAPDQIFSKSVSSLMFPHDQLLWMSDVKVLFTHVFRDFAYSTHAFTG